MAMPAGHDGTRIDEGSDHTDNVDTYRITCMDYLREISVDYYDWVDRYALPKDEDKKRRAGIATAIDRSSLWIAKVAQSIKAIDVVMNDGIQKMAEATAGRPFQLGVFINGRSGYTIAKPGVVRAVVRAVGREGRKTRLGFHYHDNRFRIESSCGAIIDESSLPLDDYDTLDIPLDICAEKAKPLDVISFTVTIYELVNGQEYDKRGISTIVHL